MLCPPLRPLPLDGRLRREQALLAALADGPCTIVELRDAVYGHLSEPRLA